MLTKNRALIALTAVLAIALTASPGSSAPRDDADWTEHYIPLPDGVNKLHADVLRPAGLDPSEKTPVILSVTPYANHGGVPLAGKPINVGNVVADARFALTGQGPSSRFYDFLDLSQALAQGYTYVMVDLPGFGGSSGCNDWGGVREQGAVKAAVEWAASQSWSTGKVALFGKSYDAWTGLMGMAQKPQGLAAVVAMEPVYNGYNYLYNNGVRFLNSVSTPALFSAFDAQPGPPTTSKPEYLATGAPQAWCYGVNVALQQQDEPDAPFWLERNLEIATEGDETPLFLTQGFLEDNTKPDAAFDFFNALGGSENRAWYGQFDHCRAYESQMACKASGTNEALASGREGFIEEVMRFLDEHLKGIQPAVEDPPIVVQDNMARYRGEQAWPPSDVQTFWNDLNLGTYKDDNGNSATGNAQSTGKGVWSFSQELQHTTWMAGEPRLSVRVDAPAPRANLVGLVYDLAPDGTAQLISRGAYLLRGTGDQVATFDLYGQDWALEPGHRIGVLVSGSDSEWWTHVPTQQTVTVKSARIRLPFLTQDRTTFLDGGMTPKLAGHLGATAPVTASTVTAQERQFDLPPPLIPPEAEQPAA